MSPLVYTPLVLVTITQNHGEQHQDGGHCSEGIMGAVIREWRTQWTPRQFTLLSTNIFTISTISVLSIYLAVRKTNRQLHY